MAASLFKGTTVEQDGRFGKSDQRLMAKMAKEGRFSQILESKVNIKKVNIAVISKWVKEKITSLVGFEDDILISMVINMLQSANLDGKKMQLDVTGFLERQAPSFMEELWTLLIDAQSQASGIPSVFIQNKKEEILKRHDSESRPNSSNQDIERGGKSRSPRKVRSPERRRPSPTRGRSPPRRRSPERRSSGRRESPRRGGGHHGNPSPQDKDRDHRGRSGERNGGRRDRDRSSDDRRDRKHRANERERSRPEGEEDRRRVESRRGVRDDKHGGDSEERHHHHSHKKHHKHHKDHSDSDSSPERRRRHSRDNDCDKHEDSHEEERKRHKHRERSSSSSSEDDRKKRRKRSRSDSGESIHLK